MNTNSTERLSADRLSAAARQLVESHLPLIGHVVRDTAHRLPPHVHLDDLTSAATAALVVAARNFDAARGVPFAAYARLCIRGALVDELRSMDWASRRVRRSVRTLQAVEDELTTALGRTPTTAELGAASGLTPAEVAEVRQDANRAAVLSLDALEAVAPITRTAGDDPETVILRRERLGYLHDALAELPERLRFVVTAYFFEQRAQHEIAAALGVTPSRVSQLQTEALRLLHAGLHGHVETTAAPLRVVPPTARMAVVTERYVQAVEARSDLARRLEITTTLGDGYQQVARRGA